MVDVGQVVAGHREYLTQFTAIQLQRDKTKQNEAARRIQSKVRDHFAMWFNYGEELLQIRPNEPTLSARIDMRSPNRQYEYSADDSNDSNDVNPPKYNLAEVLCLGASWGVKPSVEAHASLPTGYLLHFMTVVWGLSRPQIVISVTGSAQGMCSLSPKLKQVVDHGIVTLCLRSMAWVITGGTFSGVMRQVGKPLFGAPRFRG